MERTNLEWQLRAAVTEHGHDGVARLLLDIAAEQMRELEQTAMFDATAYAEQKSHRACARQRYQIWSTTANALAAVGKLRVSWRGLVRI